MKKIIIKSCSTCPLNSTNINSGSFISNTNNYNKTIDFCIILEKIIEVSPIYYIDKDSIYRNCPLEDV